MVSEFKYLKLKEGQLSNLEISQILYTCVHKSLQELNQLKTIANQQIVFFEDQTLCPYLREFCLYFGLYDLHSSLRDLEQSINVGMYNKDKYHEFLRGWTITLCQLRSQSCISRYQMPLAS